MALRIHLFKKPPYIWVLLLLMMTMMMVVVMMMIMMIMMTRIMIMIMMVLMMNIVSVKQRPGWKEHMILNYAERGFKLVLTCSAQLGRCSTLTIVIIINIITMVITIIIISIPS